MNAIVMQGKALAEKKQKHLKETIKATQLPAAQFAGPPHLVVMIVGNDPASHLYVNTKQKRCEAVGMQSTRIGLSDTISETGLLAEIEALNQDPNVHGILVQLPLPDHISTQNVIQAIAPDKDVDGFHPFNLGRLAQKAPLLRPCTPWGIMQLLSHYDIPLKGQHAVILGTSTIVGLPMSLELLTAQATITVCHRQTKHLMQLTQQADLLITATGQPEMINAEYIKQGAVVIDVGITRLDDGRIVGDVHFDSVVAKAGWITPVPGGVGPMTVTALLQNTWDAYCKQVGNAS